MTRLGILTATAAAFLIVVGCQQTTVKGPEGKSLTLTKPSDQTIQANETNQIKISIARQKFTDAVPVKFENLPSGVEVVEKELKIPSDDNSRNFTLKANPDAKLVENHEVTVIAEGPDSIRAKETFKLTVKAKK